jgi:uncharacterized protein YgiM (DUF1202 family)
VAINVRAGASLSSAIISVLAPGGSYQVLWWSNGWARVRLNNGTVGWMSGTILGAAGATARPTRQQTARVKASIQAGTGSVARAALNVRQRPSLSASIVSVLAPGGTYQVLGWSAGWARVRLADGAMGWISGSVLGTTSSAASTARNTTSSSASTQPVVTAGVRLRSGPGLSQPTIGLVAAGTHVQVLGSSVGWMKVRLPTNRTGYILGTYVKQ